MDLATTFQSTVRASCARPPRAPRTPMRPGVPGRVAVKAGASPKKASVNAVSMPAEKSSSLMPLPPTVSPKTADELVANISYHSKYTSASKPLSFEVPAAYRATAASVEERLIERWDATFSHFEQKDPKMAYYISMEYLQGRYLQNAIRNIGLKDEYSKALDKLGQDLEEIEEFETDPALGNGGLGRLASCFLDSIASCNYPAWGYGLRYKYGLFKQLVDASGQKEVPENWLDGGNPWEMRRDSIRYPVRFYGHSTGSGWEGGEVIEAVAYDSPIPGYNTVNTISLRMWNAEPVSAQFNLEAFNNGDHLHAIERQARADQINAVLYPADGTTQGKELRIRQQYFLCSASVQDIVATFKRRQMALTGKIDWDQLGSKATVQMNDTHPTLAAPELMRILLDEEGLDWDHAWKVTQGVVNYTNHTLLPEALEKWPLDLMVKLLPRHMEIITRINREFVATLKPFDDETEAEFLARVNDVSILVGCDPETGKPLEKMLKEVEVEEADSDEEGGTLETKTVKKVVEVDPPKPAVAMANLCVVAAKYVNGVAQLHTDLMKVQVFKNFARMYPEKFQNKTNGVTPRRWLAWCNPRLSAVITKWLGNDEWVTHLDQLEGLLKFKDDPKLKKEWAEAKLEQKKDLAKWLKVETGFDIPSEGFMYDVQVKRIHEYKRQLLNILAVIYRYKKMKEMSPEERKKAFVPKVVMIGGKAFATYIQAKRIVRLINNVARTVNNDPDVQDLLKVVFVPNYSVKVAEHLIPATELCQQISTAGMEASGTSNMKFMMNGALTVGTLDGANVEIRECVGEENFFLFGATADMIDGIREDRKEGKFEPDPRFEEVKAYVRSGVFGDDGETMGEFDQLMGSLEGNEGFGRADYFCVGFDFPSYLEALDAADAAYRDQDSWVTKSIIQTATSGKFSSDRTIRQYATEIWGLDEVKVPEA
ncbi:unnamed protein product [Pedinophyceae sp. YPF-701]|nr:unnamed protein product [Pedinophyceae sp. YPF-701]